MTSNGMSSRRSYLRRPKVCKSAPNPGRCHPPPPPPEVTCYINPDAPTVEFEGSLGVEFSATNPKYPEDQVVACECSASAGELTCPVILNGHVDNGEFEAPGEPGEHSLQAIFTWPDSSTCIAQNSVIEEEEPE